MDSVMIRVSVPIRTGKVAVRFVNVTCYEGNLAV